MSRTALYRHFDADGVLLYVGITCDLHNRNKGHAQSSSWHSEVSETKTQWCNSREHAMALEAVAIAYENPVWNILKRDAAPSTEIYAGGFLSDIESFMLHSGLSASYVGKAAANNSELVSRLRSGGYCSPATEMRVRRFMQSRSGAAQ